MKKKDDSKIIHIQEYLKKKEQFLKGKVTATGESGNLNTDKKETKQLSSNVVDISSYLKTKGLGEKEQKEFLINDSARQLGKIISFSQKKDLEKHSTQKFNDLKQGKSKVIFLEDYLERKNLHANVLNENPEKEMNIKPYRSMGWIAAALLAIFSTSLFYQQLNQERGLASDGEKIRPITSEEMETLEYKNNRTPQSLNKGGLSASEYVKHLRQNQNSIKIKGEKPIASDYIGY